MTEALRRQKRLLAVRSLQAELAAAELKRLHGEAAEQESILDQIRAHVVGSLQQHLSRAADTSDWTLACAEQELTRMDIDRRTDLLQQMAASLEEQRLHEAHARLAREQIQRVCDRQHAAFRYAESVRTQSSLDDLFGGGVVRRLQTGVANDCDAERTGSPSRL